MNIELLKTRLRRHRRGVGLTLAGGLGLAALLLVVGWERPVDFNHEIRPILNRECLACHGGVRRQGGLDLRFRDAALERLESGAHAILPGRPEASELVRRVRHPDPDERMPAEGPPLADDEIVRLRRWIDQGAHWATHWAYAPPREVDVPSAGRAWSRSPVDRFIADRLDEAGLRPQPEAPCDVLLRRVSLDLTGLPPHWGAVASVCRTWGTADLATRDALYLGWVDSLMATPHYGERWAVMWLDFARYADTRGYFPDLEREIWQYRDWVIDAFNRDLPYDRFTVEQLAGDLLPEPDPQQVIATAFHRNTLSNDEGGTDNEEYRVAAVVDRVNTTMEVWQGTQMACVQCHSHPYDPFDHREYYELFAFFNTTADADLPTEEPLLFTYDRLQEDQIRRLLRRIGARVPAGVTGPALEDRLAEALLPYVDPRTADSLDGLRVDKEGRLTDYARVGWARYRGIDLTGVEALSVRYVSKLEGTRLDIHLDAPDGPKLLTLTLPRSERGIEPDVVRRAVTPVEGRHDLYFRLRNTSTYPLSFRMEWFRLHPAGETPDEAEENTRRMLLSVRPGSTPVMTEQPEDERRTTRVFERGNWLAPADTVGPDVPRILPPFPADAPRNRLGLAEWLVDPDNPLTARVAVNRFWAEVFGRGLVETSEDFGTQGSPPSHPELLDWLALHFQRDLGWSMKGLVREIVRSATYRQASHLTDEALRVDPENRLLGRAPRLRFTAEQVRDAALAVSGLLNDRMYGPSQKPPQPEGVWQIQDNPNLNWEQSPGREIYRRALYTFWRRTSPYPSMDVFDSPSRESCTSRRVQTNTPLQAFVLLNDTVYVEAAQALAGRMAEDSTATIGERLRHGYRLALQREPDAEALEILSTLYGQGVRHYRNQEPETLAAVVSTHGAPTPEQAALVQVASGLLNLDAFVTRE